MAGEQDQTEPERRPRAGRSGREPAWSGGRSTSSCNQLRGFTDRARSIAGAVPSRLHLPALPSPPGAMSAAQLRAIAQTVRAQRQSIAAMPRPARRLRPAAGRLRADPRPAGRVERHLGPAGGGRRRLRPRRDGDGGTTARAGPDAARPSSSSSRGRRRSSPVTEPTRDCACRSPWISGIRSSWIRRSVSGTVSTAGSSSTRPDPLDARPERPDRLLELLDEVLRAARRSAAPTRSSRAPSSSPR